MNDNGSGCFSIIAILGGIAVIISIITSIVADINLLEFMLDF